MKRLRQALKAENAAKRVKELNKNANPKIRYTDANGELWLSTPKGAG